MTPPSRPAGREASEAGDEATPDVRKPNPEGSQAAPDVSVVLPVFNEAAHLGAEIDRIIAALEASDYTWELLVVDDGSTDGSGDLAVGRRGVRLLRSARNLGTGSARRIGTLAARGRVVVWTDADMTYPNHEIPALVDALGDADQVVGARTTEQGSLKLLRVPAKWVIRRLACYLTRTPIPDLNSGFRAMRREVAVQFTDQLPDGFSCVTTITMAFLMNGYSVRYRPIPYAARSGRSKFHWWDDTRRYGLQVIRMMLSHDPLRIFMPLAIGMGAAFAAKLGYDLVAKDLRVATNTLLLGFAAIQVLVTGLLADLAVRTSRPDKLTAPADVAEIEADPSAPAPADVTEIKADPSAPAPADVTEIKADPSTPGPAGPSE